MGINSGNEAYEDITMNSVRSVQKSFSAPSERTSK